VVLGGGLRFVVAYGGPVLLGDALRRLKGAAAALLRGLLAAVVIALILLALEVLVGVVLFEADALLH
jgi:hypothetical protein